MFGKGGSEDEAEQSDAGSEEDDDDADNQSDPIPNSFGLAVARGKSGASKEFFKFSECFEPYTAETEEGEKLRAEGMIDADPNGNGLCSLAEIETFVLKRLLSKYPNTDRGKDLQTPGKDMWKAFRYH